MKSLYPDDVSTTQHNDEWREVAPYYVNSTFNAETKAEKLHCLADRCNFTLHITIDGKVIEMDASKCPGG